MTQKNTLIFFVSIFLSCFFCIFAQAAIQEYAFDNEDDEERFKTLIAEFRCPMCINSNLAGSDAPIAANLRAEIYDQVQAGQTDKEITSFLTIRYGEFINYKPALSRSTFLLWFGPGILLIAGFIIVLRMMKSSQGLKSDTSLSDEENEKLKALLSTHQDDSNT